MRIANSSLNSSIGLGYENNFYSNTNDLLKQYQVYTSEDLFSGTPIKLEINHENHNSKKISPILELANPKDALKIASIYHELYDGTYPYREMEDIQEIKKLIENQSIRWILFKDPYSREIAGCITFVHDFNIKRGYIRGFMIRKKYQSRIDSIKAMIGSMIGTYYDFKDKIFLWYVENRTAHTSSQYPMYLCGLEPIGFYPNKDVFFNKVESDLMQIIYDKCAFTNWKTMDCPSVIPEVQNCLKYSSRKYPIKEINFKSPKIKFNKREIIKWKSRIKRKFSIDKFGYHYFELYYLGSESYLKFLYSPQLQNFEKTEYEVENDEQLFVFLQDYNMLKELLKIRYCETFVSAYKPEHQILFLNAGLQPRGYIPCWKFNTHTKRLEDYILFNWYKGNIDKKIKLIEEGKKLLDCLKIDINN